MAPEESESYGCSSSINESVSRTGTFSHEDRMLPFAMLTNLWQFYSNNVLCDVKLIVEDQVINAHRIVLSAASPYFKTMFTSGLRESNQGTIEMHEIEFDVLKEVISFFYTCKLQITDDTVFLLLNIANLLQSSQLKAACQTYFYDSLCLENCLSIYEYTELHNDVDLAEFSFRFICSNLTNIMKTEEFCMMSFKTFFKILSSSIVKYGSEIILIEGIRSWLHHDFSCRIVHAQSLLDKVDVLKLKDEDIEMYLKEHKAYVGSSETQGKCPIYLWFSQLKVKRQKLRFNDSDEELEPLKTIRRTNFRCSSEMNVIFAIGGMSAVPQRSMECITLGWNNWKCVRPTISFTNGKPCQETRVIPTMSNARVFPAIAVHDNSIYVIGGGNSEGPLDSVEMYSVASNEWKDLPVLPESLEGCAATFLNGRLYVSGGLTTSFSPSSKLWVYDNARKIWVELAPMLKARSHHGLVTSRHLLFAVGGQDSDKNALSSVECYDIETNVWIEMSPMLQARSNLGCVSIGRYIFVIGGNGSEVANRVLSSVERFDSFLNQWCEKLPLTVSRHSMGVAVMGSRIYCCGGHDGMNPLATVEKYNSQTDRWHSVLSLQRKRIGLVAASITLPALDESPP